MKKVISIVIGIIVLLGASFYGGMKYDQSKNAADRQARVQQFGGRGGANGNGGRSGMRVDAGFVAGEILSKDDTTMTIKLRDGGSKIIFLSNTTSVLKTVSGVSKDLTVGEQVTVTGSANADGSVTAESVQIRPAVPPAPSPRSGASAGLAAGAGVVAMPTATASAAAPAGHVKEFTVVGDHFTFSPTVLTITKGDTVIITFKNTEGFHDFRIDEFNAATRQMNAGSEDSVTFTADKIGTFEYYCSVGRHRQMGMKGTLIVE